MHMSRTLVQFAALICWLSGTVAVAAPTISRLSLRGLQAGGTTPLVIEGAELGPNPVLLTAVPGVTVQIKPSSTPQRIEADVTVDAQTPAGIYLFRVASATGVSSSVAVGIDPLPQSALVPQVASLPIALTGEVTGSTVVTTTFAGKRGQRVVVDVESRRIGSKLKPVVQIVDARGTQIAWGKPMPVIGGDTRADVVLPADGQYGIELHDLVYRGDAPGVFRMKIGELHYADLTFPLGVERGKPTTLGFLSTSFPNGSTAAVTLPNVGEEPAGWPTGLPGIIGSRPRLIVSAYPELSEQRADGKPQELPAAPVAVSGKITTRDEHDVYRLPVTPGQVLRFEVFAHRVGSPIDATLAVLNEQSGGLASNDDLPGTKDAGLDFTVPAGISALLIDVRDMLNRGDASGVYRLQVTLGGAPDFTLSLQEDVKQVPAGGATVLRVHADRQGFQGPIKLLLPASAGGVAANGDIPAGLDDALISIAAPASGGLSSLTTLIGETVGLEPPLRRTALTPENPATKSQPWLRSELAIGIAPPAPLTVDWTLPSGDQSLLIGQRVPLHIKVSRATNVTGAVRLSLITSQTVPKKRIAENNQPKSVDDIESTFRLEGAPVLAADQQEVTTTVIVPFNLPVMAYDAVIQADLLGADSKSVVATVFGPLRRVAVIKPQPEPPLAVFEDQPEFVALLKEGGGEIALHEADKYSGKASIRITPDQKSAANIPGLNVKIRENPVAGEYRYLQFAWKKNSGNIAIQLAHDGQFGPKDGKAPSFRYQAGPGGEFGGMALRIDAQRPQEFVLVTRDLFTDFGEFTLTGLALAAVDGQTALFDHIYLGRTPVDFELIKP